jgi:hypothetical protein
MKRRTFVKTAFAATSLAGLSKLASTTAHAADSPRGRQYYEIRTYSFDNPKQQKRVDDYWRGAAIPAFNRAGAKTIGAFTELDAPEVKTLRVLIAYDSLELRGAPRPAGGGHGVSKRRRGLSQRHQGGPRVLAGRERADHRVRRDEKTGSSRVAIRQSALDF